MRIAVAADHGGLGLRDAIVDIIHSEGHVAIVLGARLNHRTDDYPIFAKLVGDAIASGDVERGILVCGSGAGVTVAANKLPGVRSALAHDNYTAHQMIEHDLCNVMTLGAWTIGIEPARECVRSFVRAAFFGEARHRRRLRELIEFERAEHPSPLARLSESGQSIWLDNIQRSLLRSGTLARYITNLSVRGITSNPTIFEHAIARGDDYDDSIRARLGRHLSTEQIFTEIALEDINAAARLLRVVHEATDGEDGFVSIEVSPKLADDTDGTIAEARRLHGLAGSPNVFIKVPGTEAGIGAIEALIFDGVPVNVTLLFSREHYLAAANAYINGIERRINAGRGADVASVASLFISRWDVASAPDLPASLHNKLGIAVAQQVLTAADELRQSNQWKRIEGLGGRFQRVLWASTGVKDASLPAHYYVSALAAKDTINTMPESTLLEFSRTGEFGALMTADSAEAEVIIAEIAKAGLDIDALAKRLQIEGRDAFIDSYDRLISGVAAKAAFLAAGRKDAAE